MENIKVIITKLFIVLSNTLSNIICEYKDIKSESKVKINDNIKVDIIIFLFERRHLIILLFNNLLFLYILYIYFLRREHNLLYS